MLTRPAVIGARSAMLGAVFATALLASSGAALDRRTPLVALALILALVAGIGSAWSP